MFLVNSPENPQIPTVETASLKEAIQTKTQWNKEQSKGRAIITDGNGTVVTKLEQRNYLCSIYF